MKSKQTQTVHLLTHSSFSLSPDKQLIVNDSVFFSLSIPLLDLSPQQRMRERERERGGTTGATSFPVTRTGRACVCKRRGEWKAKKVRHATGCLALIGILLLLPLLSINKRCRVNATLGENSGLRASRRTISDDLSSRRDHQASDQKFVMVNEAREERERDACRVR